MFKVTVNGKVLYAEKGVRLSDLLIESGEHLEHPCGGRGTCKKCTVTVNGKEELSCKYIINSDITVVLPQKEEILSETGEMDFLTITEKPCYVLDIGTTTLALALLSEGKAEVKTATNPQRSLGADVITRIDYCRKNGIAELQRLLVEEINQMTMDFGVVTDELFVTGNTTMLHTLFGVDCSAMGVAPYTPTFLEAKTESAESLGIERVKTVKSVPSVAAFVGGDIVSGLYFAGMPKHGKYNLLVDLGTNAEVVLYSENSAVCTAAAAGPCFEGANISCGMSATEGAIYAYDSGKIKTVGNGVPQGICGTGLVDVIAWLLKTEAIDETGFFEDESIELAENVWVNQEDIRQYQLAKSAVCSAIMTLMKTEGVSPNDIEKMYISGGFSAKINIENAVFTGLLPETLAGKCVPINNSSLLGTLKFVCSGGNLEEIADKTKYIDLSATADFSQLFVNNMLF